MKSDKYVRDDT